ncbi:hypothetical protein Hsw_1303 [Hymenobacter swuensis DY53]|uniref:Uncharacterized protein n=1 Tax=Hymenobacter swuensis DY53 TaxID=1227739 RepID=W8EWF3_9BACT|nr:hypothetical protein Hsw_1303 [Hymenobacter swuensis DY53]
MQCQHSFIRHAMHNTLITKYNIFHFYYLSPVSFGTGIFLG